MNKCLCFWLVFLCLFVPKAEAVEFRNEFTLGYRQDDIAFTIAGTSAGTEPNVLSELQWETTSINLGVDLWMLWPVEYGTRQPKRFQTSPAAKSWSPALRLWGSYGFIYEGDNQDSDYFGNNRQIEFSRSNNTSDSGSLWDIHGAIGLEFARWTKNAVRLSATPFVGYSFHGQNLEITNGNQTVATEGLTPPLGPFPGLDSRYETTWHGPLVGMHLLYVMHDGYGQSRLSFWGDAIYHFLTSYEAEGRWNLRSDFAQNPSFLHKADASGWKISAGFLYHINKHSAWGLEGHYSRWSADQDGLARTFFSNGLVIDTKLNEATWDSWLLALRYSYRFPW